MTSMKNTTHNIFKNWSYIWLEEYKKNEVRESTYISSYKRVVELYILPVFAERELKDITPLELRQFFNSNISTYSKSTLHKMKICFNGIFESAIENNICDKNPAKNIKPKSVVKSQEKRIYNNLEIENILKHCETHEYGHFVRLLLESGLRASELCGLMWSDIDFNTKTISIVRACTAVKNKPCIDKTKNQSSQRKIPISSALCRLLEKAPRPSKYVVHSRRKLNTPITPSTFSKGFYKSFFKKYNLTHGIDVDNYLSPHELRHTCGTQLYKKSHDIYAVSKFLGHSSIVITSKLYVHDNVDVLRDSLQIE